MLTVPVFLLQAIARKTPAHYHVSRGFPCDIRCRFMYSWIENLQTRATSRQSQMELHLCSRKTRRGLGRVVGADHDEGGARCLEDPDPIYIYDRCRIHLLFCLFAALSLL